MHRGLGDSEVFGHFLGAEQTTIPQALTTAGQVVSSTDEGDLLDIERLAFPGSQASFMEDIGDLAIAMSVEQAVDLGDELRLELADLSPTTRSAISGPSGAMREGRVLSRSSPSKPSVAKALLPAPHAGLGLAGPPHDFERAGAVSAQQHDLGAPNVLLRAVTVFDQGNQTPMIRRRDGEGDSLRMRMSGRNH